MISMDIKEEDQIEYARKFARTLMHQVAELIDEERTNNGKVVSSLIIYNVYRLFTKALILQALTAQVNKDSNVSDLYAKTKHMVQEAVAEGFTNAFYTFTKDKDPTEFICKINALDEVRRKGTG